MMLNNTGKASHISYAQLLIPDTKDGIMSVNEQLADNSRSVTNVKANHLLEKSILPIESRQRPITAWGFVWIWVGIAVIIATFQLGANGVSGLPHYYR
jgi:cytosine/uracil/thiamine/allantoin permease